MSAESIRDESDELWSLLIDENPNESIIVEFIENNPDSCLICKRKQKELMKLKSEKKISSSLLCKILERGNKCRQQESHEGCIHLVYTPSSDDDDADNDQHSSHTKRPRILTDHSSSIELTPSTCRISVNFVAPPKFVIVVPSGITLAEFLTLFIKHQATPRRIYDPTFTWNQKHINTFEQLESKLVKDTTIYGVCFAPAITQVGSALEAYNTGRIWPPAKNYFDIEPINLKRIGYMENGESIGLFSNSAENMIVVSLGSTVNMRTAYNKHELLRWIKSCEQSGNAITLPDSRTEISDEVIEKIRSSNGHYQVIDV